jgi:hypothetical protein
LKLHKTLLTGLIKNADSIARELTVKKAFDSGLVLQSANRADSAATRALIFGQLSRLIRAVNATRSFQSENDAQDAVEDIIELFPSLKVEEILICFKQIRQGKFELFGNLTTNTLIKCLQEYELQNTIPLRERQHKELEPYINGMIDWQRLSEAIIVEQPKRSLEELGGYLHTTQHDIEQIARAQKEQYKKKDVN